MKRWKLLFFLLIIANLTYGQSDPGTAEPPVKTERQLNYVDAVILGLVEGITEYLPISSTGHLLLTNRLLELDSEAPVRGKERDIHLDEDGLPYSLKRAADAYAIIIQAGAILAVVVLYWNRLWGILLGLIGRNPEGRRLFINLMVAFFPAVVLGLLLDDWIESVLFGPIPIAIALAAGAILMWVVEKRRKRSGQAGEEGPDLHQLSWKQCLSIGLLQCVAMWPGTSRSMMTIVGGYIAGLSPKRAAEFSFLLGLITLSAAAGYRTLTDGRDMLAVLDPGPVLFGCVIAFISAVLAVKWLVGYLTRHGLGIFAWYRLVLSVLILVFAFS